MQKCDIKYMGGERFKTFEVSPKLTGSIYSLLDVLLDKIARSDLEKSVTHVAGKLHTEISAVSFA